VAAVGGAREGCWLSTRRPWEENAARLNHDDEGPHPGRRYPGRRRSPLDVALDPGRRRRLPSSASALNAPGRLPTGGCSARRLLVGVVTSRPAADAVPDPPPRSEVAAWSHPPPARAARRRPLADRAGSPDGELGAPTGARRSFSFPDLLLPLAPPPRGRAQPTTAREALHRCRRAPLRDGIILHTGVFCRCAMGTCWRQSYHLLL
jgi:hypothetical protein